MSNKKKYITIKAKMSLKKKYTTILIVCVFALLFFILLLPILGEYLSATTMLRFIFPLATFLTLAILISNILLWYSVLQLAKNKSHKRK